MENMNNMGVENMEFIIDECSEKRLLQELRLLQKSIIKKSKYYLFKNHLSYIVEQNGNDNYVIKIYQKQKLLSFKKSLIHIEHNINMFDGIGYANYSLAKFYDPYSLTCLLDKSERSARLNWLVWNNCLDRNDKRYQKAYELSILLNNGLLDKFIKDSILIEKCKQYIQLINLLAIAKTIGKYEQSWIIPDETCDLNYLLGVPCEYYNQVDNVYVQFLDDGEMDIIIPNLFTLKGKLKLNKNTKKDNIIYHMIDNKKKNIKHHIHFLFGLVEKWNTNNFN
jgi:hypothetical protein